MNKFKVGDKVKYGTIETVVAGHEREEIYTIEYEDGWSGINDDFRKGYKFVKWDAFWYAGEDELELVEEPKHTDIPHTFFGYPCSDCFLIDGKPPGKEFGPYSLYQTPDKVLIDIHQSLIDGYAAYKYPKNYKNKKTIMQTLKSVSIKLRAALGDDKANQIVAGLRNDDLSLTTEGRNTILEALAEQEIGSTALKTKADEIIAEAKKDK